MYEARLAAIAAAIRAGDVRYIRHARNQLTERNVTGRELERALSEGDAEVIEDYPNATRGACCLVLCWMNGRAVHVMVTYPPRPRVVTVYWPDTRPND